MKIEIVVDPSRPLSLASRVAPAAVVANGTTPAAPKYVYQVLLLSLVANR